MGQGGGQGHQRTVLSDGGWGGGVGGGGGPGRRAGGEMGGGASSVGATKSAPVPPLTSLKNLTLGLTWPVTRGGGGEAWGGGGPGRRAKEGEMGAAESWEVKWRGLTRCGGLTNVWVDLG